MHSFHIGPTLFLLKTPTCLNGLNEKKQYIRLQVVKLYDQKFYFRILSRFLFRTIKLQNEIEYENKF